ncbi:unnamed protein product [Ascophyllum nodosum]
MFVFRPLLMDIKSMVPGEAGGEADATCLTTPTGDGAGLRCHA